MSDQTPPKPKPGSLRDRIAAFEKPSLAPVPGPPTRPKSGAVSWKPKAHSPPSSPGLSIDHGSATEKKLLGGMSAFDAKESIGKGGSLKERMAALQGKGGFGAPPPLAPRSSLEKPKWKPPPVVSPPSDDEDINEGSYRSNKVALVECSSDPTSRETPDEEPSIAIEDETDPEEMERHRRAAIAARMARLGGARVGMAPPTFGKKPSIKRADSQKMDDQSLKEEDKSLAIDTPHRAETLFVRPPPAEGATDVIGGEQTRDFFPARQDSASPSVLSGDPTSTSQSARTPSMPVPAGPRRTAPPRKKVANSPSSVSGAQMLDKDVQKSPETVSAKAGNTAQDYAFTENEGTHEETSSEHVTEEHDGLETPTPNAEAEVDKYDKRTSADIGTGDQFVVSREGAALDVQGKAFYSSASVTEELGVDAAEAFAEPNEENDATRCKGVAERLAKMGAFNPLSAPHRQTSITPRDSPVESEAVPLPIAPSHLPEVPGQGNLRKGSVDSAASNSRLLEMPDLRDSNIGPQNVFPYPPHAEHSRTSSLHSTVSKAEDESQDELEGLRDEHEVATAYDEYQMRNQHEADDDNLRGVPEIDLEHESQSAAPLTKQWETNVTGIEPSDANQGDNQADGRSSQISPSLPLTLNVNIRPTAPTQSEQLHSHIAPQVSSRISMLVTSQYVLEDEGPQEDTHSTPSRHIPPPRIFLEEESRCEEETEAVHSATPLPPPPRILPHSPEDDYQSESEPTPIPLPRSSRKSISLRPVFSESGGPPTDRDSIVATRPRRPIPPPPMQNDSQESLDTPTLLLDPDKLEEKEEILPTPPPRRSRPPRDVPRFHKESMVDSETEGLVVISVPSARMRLPSAHSSLSHQLVSPLVEERPPLYHTTPSLSVEGQEVIDESEGDPIDPAFHSPSRRGSPVDVTPPRPIPALAPEPTVETEENSDRTQPRTIADRMATLGRIKFGAPPAIGRSLAAHTERNNPCPSDPIQKEETVQIENDGEVARKQRIAAKLASMGGQRFGMLPLGSGGALSQPRPRRPESETFIPLPSSPLCSVPPSQQFPLLQPQDIESEYDSMPSEDGVQVEAEESELEEVSHKDTEEEEEIPPPLPTRAGRSSGSQSREEQPRRMSRPPPVPTIPLNFLNRQSSMHSTPTHLRKGSIESAFSYHRGPPTPTLPQRPPSFVMVDEPGSIEHGEDPSLARPTSQALPAANITASQWEFPSLPRSLDFGDGSVDLSLSSWTDVGDPSTKHSSQLPPSGASSKGPSTDTHLTPDDLMTVWGRVGVQICEVATTLYEKSRKSLVGDGSYKGYVDAVLSQVPNAVLPSPPSYGYLIYVQVGSSVQKRASEIMPGDIVVIFDARFKGHKGIQTYHQNVGADVPLMGIVNEFEPKKSKIKVFEANQHVGQQTVESVSYRLEDLRSGSVKIFRVLEA